MQTYRAVDDGASTMTVILEVQHIAAAFCVAWLFWGGFYVCSIAEGIYEDGEELSYYSKKQLIPEMLVRLIGGIFVRIAETWRGSIICPKDLPAWRVAAYFIEMCFYAWSGVSLLAVMFGLSS